jgi:hypothetical protein
MLEIASDQYSDWHEPTPFLCILGSNEITGFPLPQICRRPLDDGDASAVSNHAVSQSPSL